MNLYLALILSAIISYLIGSLNFAIIISFLHKKEDIREHGSKNAGMTNVIRVYGVSSGIPVFLGDFFKAVVAVYLCDFLFHNVNQYSSYGNLIVGLSVVVGHLYPVYFNFKGGKGIATSAGFILTQDIKIFIFVACVFILILLIFKIVGLASLCAAVGYPIASLVFFQNYLAFILSLIISSLVIYSHRSNIKKLLQKIKL